MANINTNTTEGILGLKEERKIHCVVAASCGAPDQELYYVHTGEGCRKEGAGESS